LRDHFGARERDGKGKREGKRKGRKGTGKHPRDKFLVTALREREESGVRRCNRQLPSASASAAATTAAETARLAVLARRNVQFGLRRQQLRRVSDRFQQLVCIDEVRRRNSQLAHASRRTIDFIDVVADVECRSSRSSELIRS